jgi:hypothetical protein
MSMRIASAVALVCFVVLPAQLTAGEPVEYVYRGWLEDEFLYIRPPSDGTSDGVLVLGGDALEPAEFCTSESEFICILSRRYTFAVPKRLEAAKQWILRGITFELAGEDLSVSIFGKKFDGLLLIRTPSEAFASGRSTGKPSYFLYSYRHGLVGFGRDPLPDGAATTYWMAEQVGFGASNPELRNPGHRGKVN